MPLGLLPQEPSTSRRLITKELNCVKCSAQAQYTAADPRVAYCQSCFINMIQHKIRSSLGKYRVFKQANYEEGFQKCLLVYDGTAASATMLSLLADSIKPRQNDKIEARKLHIEPTLVVLVSRLFDDEVLDSLKRHVDALKQSFGIEEWTVRFVHMASCYEISSTSLEKYKEALRTLEKHCTPTAVDDFVEFIRECVLLRVARALGINRVLTAETSDVLARRTFNLMCTGRGAIVARNSSVIDVVEGNLRFVRPLRDVSNKECALYLHCIGREDAAYFDSSQASVTASKSVVPQSIAGVTDTFMSHVHNVNFASYSTVLATTSKLAVEKNNKNSCEMCRMPTQKDSCDMCTPILQCLTQSDLTPYLV